MVAVEEVSDDGRVLFLGFHTYDSDTKQYLNWGASSLFDLGWAHGVLGEDGAVMHYMAGGSVDLPDPHSPAIPGRGEWRLVDDNHHVFQWFATIDDGTEYLLKESRYSRR